MAKQTINYNFTTFDGKFASRELNVNWANLKNLQECALKEVLEDVENRYQTKSVGIKSLSISITENVPE